MHYTSWIAFSVFFPRCILHLMPFVVISQGLYSCEIKTMSQMYVVSSKQKALTGSMPNVQSHLSSIVEFGESFQPQKLLYHDYNSYLMATRTSSAQTNRTENNHSFPRMPMLWLHASLILHDLVSCQILLVSPCIIEWALIRMD
jgi:hypothetical protein